MHLEGKKIIGVTILSWGWKKFEVKRVSVLLGTEVLKSVIWRKNTEEMEKYPIKTIIILTEQQKQSNQSLLETLSQLPATLIK